MTIKNAGMAIALIVLGAVVIWQQGRIHRFAPEDASARGQDNQESSLISERRGEVQGDELPTNSVLALPQDESHELLRLRGEVAVLRGQLAEAARISNVSVHRGAFYSTRLAGDKLSG